MNPMEPCSARQEQEVSEGYGFRTVQDVSGRITQKRIRNQQVLGSIPSAGSNRIRSLSTYATYRPGSCETRIPWTVRPGPRSHR
jgi:hypothetical protein